MLGKFDRQIQEETNKLEASQANVHQIGEQINALQRKLMGLSVNLNSKPDTHDSKIRAREDLLKRSQQALDKLQDQFDSIQEELLALQRQGEKIQREMRKELLKNKEHRIDLNNLQQKIRTDSESTRKKFEVENKNVQAKLHMKETEQKRWEGQARAARTKVQILQGRQTEDLKRNETNTNSRPYR